MDIVIPAIILGVIVLAFLGMVTDVGQALRGALRWGRRPPTNIDAIREGTVTHEFSCRPSSATATGKVEASGAIWNASCPSDEASRIKVGDTVKIDRVDGLTLVVSRIEGAV